jgi:transcriptional regulator with XRE-family HTH domain
VGIKTARTKAGMSQEQLAIKLGIERSTVAKWETGKSLPRAELLLDIASILKCSVEMLLRKDESAN